MFLPKILIALAFCAGTLTATAQTAKKISTLKSQRANLQKKIKENEGMLKTLKKDVRSQLNNLSVLNGQINSQKKLVDAISSDVGQMDSMITSLNTQLDTLKKELDERKQRYRRSVLYLYRNRTTQNKLMFIFSADNFTQMYRRLRYVRQYAEYQRIQGELVQRKQEQIQNKRNEISQARAEKGALLDQGKQEQAKLESKHAERKKLVSKLQKQQRKVQSTLQANKKQYNSLNAQIDKLIQQQIAEERRRREEARNRELERQRRLAAANKKKSRSSKSKSSSKRSSERSSEEKREQMAVFEMEKADRAGCANVRFLIADGAAIDMLLPAHSVARLYLNFSDPWPKKRNAKRRLTSPLFLERYKTILAPGGRIFFKTDNRPLFDYSLETFAASGYTLENVCFDLHGSPMAAENIMTEYERNFSAKGFAINYLEAFLK